MLVPRVSCNCDRNVSIAIFVFLETSVMFNRSNASAMLSVSCSDSAFKISVDFSRRSVVAVGKGSARSLMQHK